MGDGAASGGDGAREHRYVPRCSFGSDREGPQRRTAAVRDVVEIVAIVAAGIWAIYTFVYVERLKPAWARPDVGLTASLHKLGERNGLVGRDARAAFEGRPRGVRFGE